MAKYGPLCVGIDPHRQLLTDWGYNVDALGAELYSMRMLQAANGRAAAVKFQSSMFERYGSKGIAALERVLYAARQMGVITIVDCLHGGLPTTISAFADAYFKPGAPLLADAITLLPYYGARSLGGVINDALNNGRGVFIASLTSNQEGASLRYVAHVTDTTVFSPLFVDALAWLLASYLAGPVLKGDAGAAMAKACLQSFMLALSNAKVSDANQRKVRPEHKPDWIAGR
jgi:orotidine 5'-phosphate decarboxylase subfamily 2